MVMSVAPAHTAHMEVINQDIVVQVIAVLFVPMALITANTNISRVFFIFWCPLRQSER